MLEQKYINFYILTKIHNIYALTEIHKHVCFNRDTWDPSLMFVMMGAHAIALPFYQLVVKRIYNEGRGVALSGDKFGLPPVTNPIDLKVCMCLCVCARCVCVCVSAQGGYVCVCVCVYVSHFA
jgi:hypothetical protein